MNPSQYRQANAKEAQVWRETVDMSDRVHAGIYACQLLNANSAAMYQFSQNANAGLPSPADTEKRLIALESEYSKHRQAIERVEDRIWALRFNSDGTFDIVMPQQEQTTMGWVWVIPVAVGLGAALLLVIKDFMGEVFKDLSKQASLVAELKRYQEMGDAVFSKTPQMKDAWNKFKAASAYVEREEEADGILDKIGKGIVKGATWGIGIGLAALGIMLALSMRRK